jgi:uncharacterized protein YcfJ
MNVRTSLLLGTLGLMLSTPALARITFYEAEGFRGRAFTADRAAANLKNHRINDFAASIVIDRGRWEVCEDANYRGNCVVLREGSYDSLHQLGLHRRISSMRPASSRRQYPNEVPAPLATPNYPYHRRPNERVYQARVTSARAVIGDGGQRCWIEREQVDQRYRSQGGSNVGGAIAGAIIGGILGHQVGSGSGRTAATAGGAAIGAAIGAQTGSDRDYGTGYERDVRRCERYGGGTPQYWDVSYVYRGVEHWVRMSSPPGRTIAVNRNGEPRQ